MARAHAAALAAALLLSVTAACAETADGAAAAQSDVRVPPDCRVDLPFQTPAPLRGLDQALKARRPVKLLLIGPTSAAGVGATSAFAAYPARLEKILEAHFKGVDFEVIRRGLAREVAEDQVERVKLEVADVLPDLVVWQVGARDAMARVDPDAFAASLASAVSWFRDNRIDLVLVEPPYSERRATDDYFLAFVKAIGAVAEREQVPLIRRFEAMHALAAPERQPDDEPPDPVQLTELGYRCLGTYVADTIVRGLRLASAKEP